MASQHSEGETSTLPNNDNIPISSEIGMVGSARPSTVSDGPVNVVSPQGVVDEINAKMIEETFKAEIDRLKLELLRRDSCINWLQDRVDLWSNEVIRLTHHREDDERFLYEERVARRCAERELVVARREVEEARRAWDELFLQMRGDDVESIGSANSAT